MLGFLKVFGKGILYTILLPFIILIWALFTVYCVFLFIYSFCKNTIIWLKGGSPFGDTKEDVEAKRILLEQQNQQANAQTNNQYKDALIATLASAVAAQAQSGQQPQPQQNADAVDVFPTQEIDYEEPSQLENYLDEEKGDEQ